MKLKMEKSLVNLLYKVASEVERKWEEEINKLREVLNKTSCERYRFMPALLVEVPSEFFDLSTTYIHHCYTDGGLNLFCTFIPPLEFSYFLVMENNLIKDVEFIDSCTSIYPIGGFSIAHQPLEIEKCKQLKKDKNNIYGHYHPYLKFSFPKISKRETVKILGQTISLPAAYKIVEKETTPGLLSQDDKEEIEIGEIRHLLFKTVDGYGNRFFRKDKLGRVRKIRVEMVEDHKERKVPSIDIYFKFRKERGIIAKHVMYFLPLLFFNRKYPNRRPYEKDIEKLFESSEK